MRWLDPTPITVPDDLCISVGGHSLVAERLARAGLTTTAAAQAFLDPSAYTVTSPFELPDLEGAVARLDRAIASGERILIWGDFDVDGQTATALLYSALRTLGADVRYHVPLRQGEGHGMHLSKLREWLKRGVNVIITCDTGITAHEAVDLAQSAGVDVVITDHHLLGDTLPAAHSVINPMRLPPGHALRDLPGVGVAYELMAALSAGHRSDELLDLVALGIVADVAVQRNETRYLLQRGIEIMRLTSRPGLRALFERVGINQLELTEVEIGFGLAPRLNAQGRLGDAAASVELLTTQDEARAAELANQLEGMNARRKLESRLIEDGARSIIERDPSLLEYAAIILAHPEWSGGIVGIVANRLAEAWHKPVIMLCEGDEVAFGSARSVPGCNITEALRANRELLLKFGGHAMAAGMSLRRDDVYEFRRRLSRTVREMAPGVTEEPALSIDGYVSLGEITLDLARDLRRLAPFGNGNPALTLATRDLRLVRRKKLGRRGDHFEMLVEDKAGARQRVLWWNAGAVQPPALEDRFDLAYTLNVRRVKDRVEAVIELVDLRPTESKAIVADPEAPAFELDDLRQRPDAIVTLAQLRAQYPDAIVWREDDPTVEGYPRTALRPAETLIVWTPPPGPEEWQTALELVNPRRVIVLGQPPGEVTHDVFLRRLGGLLKHVINASGGDTTVATLASATSQRTDAVRYGLRWFAETGRLDVDFRSDGGVKISRPQAQRPVHLDQPSLEKLLRAVLEETAAYRRNWMPRP